MKKWHLIVYIKPSNVFYGEKDKNKKTMLPYTRYTFHEYPCSLPGINRCYVKIKFNASAERLYKLRNVTTDEKIYLH